MNAKRYAVRKQPPRSWGIYEVATGRLVEGGFFYRDSALDALAEWEREATHNATTQPDR